MSLTYETYPTTVLREVGDNGNKVVTFRAAADTSYALGDLVTIDANGRVAKVSDAAAVVDGVVAASVNNTGGAADAKQVPVTLKGVVWVDVSLAHDGTALTIGAIANTITGGQVIRPAASGNNRTFTSLSIQAVPASGFATYKGLFYFQGTGKFV